MQPALAIIPVPTEKQALDWSLVLVSQGIDTSIGCDPEVNSWQLIVPLNDHALALRALTQYRSENQFRPWRQELPWTGLLFDGRSAVCMLLFVLLYAIEATGHGDLRAAGLMDNQAVRAGEWWRLITAVTLHGDLAHLAANVTTGLLLLGLAMGASGPGVGLLASFLGGVGGNLAGLWLHGETHRSLGASGMVMGALGLLAAQWLGLLRRGVSPRQLAVRGVLSGCFLLVLLGLSPQKNVDVLAHVAGFITGFVLGTGLAFCPDGFPRQRWLNLFAVLVCLALTGVAWWQALK